MEIIPAVLEENFSEIEKKIKLFSSFASFIHVDFIDGNFAPNKTFLTSAPFLSLANSVNLEAHLMVKNPINYLEPLFNAGFHRFIGQIEKMPDQEQFVAKGQLLGEVGLAIDIETTIESLKIPLEDLDIVLLMAVKAGASGQKFDERVLAKIKNLREKTFIPIVVDGGINPETIVLCKNAGAERACVNSFLLRGSPNEQYRNLLKGLD